MAIKGDKVTIKIGDKVIAIAKSCTVYCGIGVDVTEDLSESALKRKN